LLRQLRGFTSELSMASPKVALRIIIISTLFSMLCLLSPVTYAATQIKLEQGYEIRFGGGNIDTETFHMQITDVEVFKNDRRYWNADAILLETILLADGQTLIVKNLKIDGFVSSVDEVKVGSIIVRNITLDKYDHLLAGKIGSLLDHALDNAYLGIFDFSAPIERGAEYDIFVQSMELTPVWRTTLSSGNSYFNRIGMRGEASVKHRRLHNQNSGRSAEKIAGDELVTKLSLQNFEIAVDIENVLIEDGAVMRSELSGRVDIKNHFSSDIEFDAQIPLSLFEDFMHSKDMNTVFTRKFAEESGQSFFASFLQSDPALSKVSLGVRDYGTFERLFDLYAKRSGQSVTAAIEDIRFKIEQGINENIPNEGPRLFSAIDKFLDHGGQLRLSAAPDAPVPFLFFASYLLMPETAIKQLNVTIEHLD
jgi:hypothetical protein